MPIFYSHSGNFNFEFNSQIELDDLEDCNCHGISHINCFQKELLETDLDATQFKIPANSETVNKIPFVNKTTHHVLERSKPTALY